MDAQPPARPKSLFFTNALLAVIAVGVCILTINSMTERSVREDYRRAVENDLQTQPFTDDVTRSKAPRRAQWAEFGLGEGR